MTSEKIKSRFQVAFLAGTLIFAGTTFSGEPENSNKPFAEAHIVLQLADDDPKIQARTISVANNLIKHYGGPEFVDIEIVAYGPGISLLYPSNPANERVTSLLASEVRFVGCMNTV